MPETFDNIMALLGLDINVVGTWVAALLTLAVLSYVFGENLLFRLAEYLFVGIAAGYAAGLAWQHVLWPRLYLLLSEPGSYWYYGIFFVLGLLLLSRGVRPLAKLADLPLGVMVGTGAGLALGGALTGSLIPQLQASITSLNPAFYGGELLGWFLALDALLIVVATIAVFSTFHYTTKGQGVMGRLGNRMLQGMGKLGQKLIMMAFGVLLAGALLSFFTLLGSRVTFLVQAWGQLLTGLGL